MNRHILNSRSPRCRYRTPSGRQCRLEALAGSAFCARHRPAPAAESPDLNLESELTAGLEKFDSPAAINDFLTRLARLLAQARISARRAAVLAYISNQILRSVRAIGEAEEKGRASQPVEYIIGVPRPNYDEPDNRQSAHQQSGDDADAGGF